jgi:glycine/D-amino acid oxidase-like deaminating enzyme
MKIERAKDQDHGLEVNNNQDWPSEADGPSWFDSYSHANIKWAPRSTAGRIDVKETAIWLREQCERLGVEFRFSVQAHGVTWDSKDRITSLDIGEVDIGRPTETLRCDKLIIAAGPFTTGIYKALFPNSKLDLQNHVQQVQRIQLRDVNMSANGSGAMFLKNVASDDFEDTMKIISNKEKGTVDASMILRNRKDLPLTGKTTIKHNRRLADTLLARAAEHLTSFGDDVEIDRSKVSHQSRSWISTGNCGRPVVGKVPVGPLGDSDGVFLAYGFGNFGTTLAPKVGDIITKLVCGEELDSGIMDFEVGTSATERPKRKAKTRTVAASPKAKPKVTLKGKGRTRAIGLDKAKPKSKGTR